MHPAQSPARPPTPSAARPKQAPTRSKLTDRLLYTWERLRPAQRDAAWEMVATMRATHANERRRRRILSVAIVGALLADALLVYLLLWAPGH